MQSVEGKTSVKCFAVSLSEAKKEPKRKIKIGHLSHTVTDQIVINLQQFPLPFPHIR